MIKLKDIKEYMINSLDYEPINLDEYPYDIDGHCGDGLYEEIKEFWRKFRTRSDFEFVVTGRFMSDDIDLSGGRSYLLSDDKLIDMLFDYMINTLNWSKEDYQEKIHNSLEITEEIEDRYELFHNKTDDISSLKEEKIISKVNKLKCITTKFNHYLTCPIKIGKTYLINDENRVWEDSFKMIYINIDGERMEFSKECFKPYKQDNYTSEINEESEDKYDSINDNSSKKVNVWNNINLEEYDYIPKVVMYHKDRKEELDSYDSIEYIGETLINKKRIAYRIKSLGVKIPKGYEIIEPLEEILKIG